ncbi:MAG: GGDEF domain-containing protein [Proteobacteria bacterium]|nr:GGDEF domain-containing protein [Pseudomonadota bacterium]
MTDELTGLLNRRAFESELRHAVAAARRYGEGGVLIYIDLDNFKPVNDRFGHAAGDHVLRQVARLLKASVRETDFVGRLGGDEFAVLLVRTSWEAGLAYAKRLERALNATYIPWSGATIKLKASFGAQRYGADDSERTLLHRADTAMYRAKRRRTNADALLLS